MSQLTIESKIIGRRGPMLSPILLELDQPRLTVRDLLAAVVRQQVTAFAERQESRRLLQILTEGQMADGLSVGRLRFGGAEADELSRPVDVAQATDAATSAFADEFFYLFLDGQQVMGLDSVIDLSRPKVQALFVRLVPLVGG